VECGVLDVESVTSHEKNLLPTNFSISHKRSKASLRAAARRNSDPKPVNVRSLVEGFMFLGEESPPWKARTSRIDSELSGQRLIEALGATADDKLLAPEDQSDALA
jgi:hypothetical protein